MERTAVANSSLRIVVTGAAGRIAYALIPYLLNGTIFGSNTRISLRLLDVEQAESLLIGVKLEIDDSCFVLLDDVIGTTDAETAFTGADVAILLGGYPRLPGMERRDLIERNAAGMRDQAIALDRYASRDCKVLVIANPANTNCWVCIRSCQRIPPQNFSCLTRLDHERLRGLSTEKVNMYLNGTGWQDKIVPSAVRNIAIFGNHSNTQVPYIDSGTFTVDNETRPLTFPFTEEAKDVLTARVQRRGAEILEYLGASSAMSCASAISKHLKDWLGPEIPTDMFSMGILSNGNPYNIPNDLVFSFPVVRTPDGVSGAVTIVPNLPISPKIRNMLDISSRELSVEKDEAAIMLADIE